MGKINILNDAGTAKLSLEFTGTTNKSINTEHLSSITSDVQNQLNLKAPLANPTFSGLLTTTGTVEVQGGNGGIALLLKNGGDLRLQNAANTGSVHAYCDTDGILTVYGKLGPTVGTANAVSNATAITVATTTPTVIASCTITTHGYPVLLVATGDCNPDVGGNWHYLDLAIGGTRVGKLVINQTSNPSYNNPWALTHIHTPPAGTHTFQVRAWQGSGTITYGETGDQQAPTIVAVELR